MRCYDFVLASMYRYSWLITFEIFRNFFFDRGVGGWGVSYPNFFWIFIFTRPLNHSPIGFVNKFLTKKWCDTFHDRTFHRNKRVTKGFLVTPLHLYILIFLNNMSDYKKEHLKVCIQILADDIICRL